MLVLSRFENQSIVIDPRNCPVDELGLITIKIVKTHADKVRLGIEAPKAIAVHRSEIFDAIQRSKGESHDKPAA